MNLEQELRRSEERQENVRQVCEKTESLTMHSLITFQVADVPDIAEVSEVSEEETSGNAVAGSVEEEVRCIKKVMQV